jgi:hypothetical protein
MKGRNKKEQFISRKRVRVGGEVHPFDRAKPHLSRWSREARLRVNLEQAPAFRPGSREVHFFLGSLTSVEPEGYIESDSVMNRSNLRKGEANYDGPCKGFY